MAVTLRLDFVHTVQGHLKQDWPKPPSCAGCSEQAWSQAYACMHGNTCIMWHKHRHDRHCKPGQDHCSPFWRCARNVGTDICWDCYISDYTRHPCWELKHAQCLQASSPRAHDKAVTGWWWWLCDRQQAAFGASCYLLHACMPSTLSPIPTYRCKRSRNMSLHSSLLHMHAEVFQAASQLI